MNNIPKNRVVSDVKKWMIAILIVTGLFFLIGGVNLVYNTFLDDYIEFVPAIFGVLFIILGLLCIVWLFSLERIYVDKNHLILERVFIKNKRRVKISDITSYTELKKQSQHIEWKELTLFSTSEKIKINSYDNPHYFRAKKRLTEGKERDLGSEKLWYYRSRKRGYVTFFIIGLLLSLLFYNMYITRNDEVQRSDLITLEECIVSAIELKGRRKGSDVIEIKIKRFDGLKFKLGGFGVGRNTIESFMSGVKVGDLLNIDILKDNYNKKITKEEKLTIKDKAINYETIWLYGVRDERNEYFSLFNRNRGYRKDRNSFSTLALLGFSIFITCFFTVKLMRNKKPVANNS